MIGSIAGMGAGAAAGSAAGPLGTVGGGAAGSLAGGTAGRGLGHLLGSGIDWFTGDTRTGQNTLMQNTFDPTTMAFDTAIGGLIPGGGIAGRAIFRGLGKGTQGAAKAMMNNPGTRFATQEAAEAFAKANPWRAAGLAARGEAVVRATQAPTRQSLAQGIKSLGTREGRASALRKLAPYGVMGGVGGVLNAGSGSNVSAGGAKGGYNPFTTSQGYTNVVGNRNSGYSGVSRFAQS
jgi:hypothetical protein